MKSREENTGFFQVDKGISQRIREQLGLEEVVEDSNGQLRFTFNEDPVKSYWERVALIVLPRIKGELNREKLIKRLSRARDVLNESDYEVKFSSKESEEDLQKKYVQLRAYVWPRVEEHCPELGRGISEENERLKNSAFFYR